MTTLTKTQEWSRIDNAKNRHQGMWPRVLCVCTGGLLRSPTLAWVLSNPPYNCNVRAAGVDPRYALVLVDTALMMWADTVVFANKENLDSLSPKMRPLLRDYYVLDLPDRFDFRDPKLVVAANAELLRVGFPHYHSVY